jgi:hypothetical protein
VSRTAVHGTSVDRSPGHQGFKRRH